MSFVCRKHIGITRGSFAKPSALVCVHQRRDNRFVRLSYIVNISIRLSRVTNALALKGYNVTVLSADIERKPVKNLHYLHLDKVYDRLYNDKDFLVNFIEIGKLNPWFFLGKLYEFCWATCEGAVISSGWKRLRDYPDDFKVFKN